MERTRVVFICTGNICRSPLAEAYLRDAARRRGVADRLTIDSAGLDAYHIGEQADPRMIKTARRHGIRIDHRARIFDPSEVGDWDLVVVMDGGHLRRLASSTARELHDRIVLFRSYDPASHGDEDVPDPWYGSDDGFERVYRIVERTAERLLDALVSEDAG